MCTNMRLKCAWGGVLHIELSKIFFGICRCVHESVKGDAGLCSAVQVRSQLLQML